GMLKLLPELGSSGNPQAGKRALRRVFSRLCGPLFLYKLSRRKVRTESNEMEDVNAVRERIKTMLVENLMLQIRATEIANDQPLFGPGSLGLDSVDALQLVVALDKNFGLKVADPAAAKEILQTVNTIASAVQRLRSA